MNKEKFNVTIVVSSIKTLKFLVDNTEAAYKNDRMNFHFNFSLATFLAVEQDIIGFDIIIDVFTEKELTNKVSELICRIEFKILNLAEIVKVNDKEADVPDTLMMTLVSISLSTARGILAAKTEGSALEGVYMPVVDPKSFRPQSQTNI